MSLDPIPTVPHIGSHHRVKETRNTIRLGALLICGDESCYYEDDPVVTYRGIDFVQQRGVFLKEYISGPGIDDSEDIYWHYYLGYLDSGRVLTAGRRFNSGYNRVNVAVNSDYHYSPNEIRNVTFGTHGVGSTLWTDSFGGYIVSGRYIGAMIGADIDNDNFVMGDAAISGQLVEFAGTTFSVLPVFDVRFTNVLDLSSGRRYADIEGEIGYGGLLFDPEGSYRFDRGDFIAASIDFVRGNDEAVGSFETDDLIGVFGATRQ